jgi:tetratricopeptide (TPR) repeat protein
MSSENRVDPSDIQMLWDQATALFGEGRYGEAIDCLRALEPRLADHPQLLANLGVMYRDSGDLARAEQYFRRLCALRPRDAAAHFNLAVTLLGAGRWREGFREYEWRWQVAQFAAQLRRFPQPVWRGEPLDGKRILLWGEQGAGDGIQFLRYAPMVRNAGGAVILEVLPHMERLVSWMEGGYRVVNALTKDVEFDVHCPLMSLPERFGTEPGSIPRPTCFTIPAEARARWAARMRTGGKNAGLVWAANPSYGNNSKRSVPGHLFEPLTQMPDVRCWGLQVGPAAAETPEGLVNLADELIDFGATAAIICELDLVITVDTAVAHLAGSLGKTVWVLLSYASDWRWLLDREDTPWYPTMRLFRQTRPGEWGDVIERVMQALQR